MSGVLARGGHILGSHLRQDPTRFSTSILAHAAGHTARQNLVETLLLLGGATLVYLAFRVRGVRRRGRPVASWAVGSLALAVLALAFIVPARLGVRVAPTRPSTDASIAILAPAPGQVFRGKDAKIRIKVKVTGARIVSQTSTRLSPRKGHIHLYVDGELASMAYMTSSTIYASPGRHLLKAEFVATDHGPFDPPITAYIRFRVLP